MSETQQAIPGGAAATTAEVSLLDQIVEQGRFGDEPAAQQRGKDLVLYLDRVVAGIERGLPEVRTDCFGEAPAAIKRRGVGHIVVHAQEAFHARGLGTLAGLLARNILGLADVQQRTQFLALPGVPRVVGDNGNTLCHDGLDGSTHDIEVGDRGCHAVIVARRRLLQQMHHIGKIAIGRVAIIDRDIEVFLGIGDTVLHDIPERIGIGRVGYDYEPRSLRDRAHTECHHRHCGDEACHSFHACLLSVYVGRLANGFPVDRNHAVAEHARRKDR